MQEDHEFHVDRMARKRCKSYATPLRIILVFEEESRRVRGDLALRGDP